MILSLSKGPGPDGGDPGDKNPLTDQEDRVNRAGFGRNLLLKMATFV